MSPGSPSAGAVRAVLFDYGGVLTSPIAASIRAWLERDGVAVESFSAVLKAWLSRDAPAGTPVHRLETGELSAERFGELLAAELAGRDGRPIRPDRVLGRIFAELRPDPIMFDLARELRRSGLRVGLLSNSWGNTYPRPEIDELFDPVVISGEVGLRKPDRAIFELALARLGLPARAVAFVDDATPNVEGAEAAGLIGIRHADATSTRGALSALVPRLTCPPPVPAGSIRKERK